MATVKRRQSLPVAATGEARAVTTHARHAAARGGTASRTATVRGANAARAKGLHATVRSHWCSQMTGETANGGRAWVGPPAWRRHVQPYRLRGALASERK